MYFGIHPGIVPPQHKFDHYINLTENDDYEDSAHFPILDRKAPSITYLTRIVDYILSLDGSIYIFCKGGHGRSGTVASAIYGKLKNVEGDEAMKAVHNKWKRYRDMDKIRPKIRRLGVPQTKSQKDVVRKYLNN